MTINKTYKASRLRSSLLYALLRYLLHLSPNISFRYKTRKMFLQSTVLVALGVAIAAADEIHLANCVTTGPGGPILGVYTGRHNTGK